MATVLLTSDVFDPRRGDDWTSDDEAGREKLLEPRPMDALLLLLKLLLLLTLFEPPSHGAARSSAAEVDRTDDGEDDGCCAQLDAELGVACPPR